MLRDCLGVSFKLCECITGLYLNDNVLYFQRLICKISEASSDFSKEHKKGYIFFFGYCTVSIAKLVLSERGENCSALSLFDLIWFILVKISALSNHC